MNEVPVGKFAVGLDASQITLLKHVLEQPAGEYERLIDALQAQSREVYLTERPTDRLQDAATRSSENEVSWFGWPH